jgi:hypothetical protein
MEEREMRGKVLWMFLLCALVLAGGAWAQTRLEPIDGDEETLPEEPPASIEDCGNGFDDDGNGAADCADIACANDPACGDEAPCPEVEVHDTDGVITFKHTPGKVCSNNVTDSDGRNYTARGCLSYWNDGQCTQGPINWEWDTCSGNKLTEWYTGGAGRTACGSRGTVTRDCDDLITCPGGAVPTCQNAAVFCGPQQRQIGACVCPVLVAVGEEEEELPEEP